MPLQRLQQLREVLRASQPGDRQYKIQKPFRFREQIQEGKVQKGQ